MASTHNCHPEVSSCNWRCKEGQTWREPCPSARFHSDRHLALRLTELPKLRPFLVLLVKREPQFFRWHPPFFPLRGAQSMGFPEIGASGQAVLCVSLERRDVWALHGAYHGGRGGAR